MKKLIGTAVAGLVVSVSIVLGSTNENASTRQKTKETLPPSLQSAATKTFSEGKRYFIWIPEDKKPSVWGGSGMPTFFTCELHYVRAPSTTNDVAVIRMMAKVADSSKEA